MKRVLFVLMLGIVGLSGSHAQERVVLDTAVYASPGVTNFRLMQLFLQRASHIGITSGARIQAILGEVDGNNNFVQDGKILECVWTDAGALDILRALNTADFSNNSLEKRVITRCQIDGKIGPGQIIGVPDTQ